MTSEERHEARYRRRKMRRMQHRRNLHPGADNYDAVFSFGALWRSYRNCRKNVSWKGSVQRYILASPIRVAKTYRELAAHKYKCITPHEWDTWERGKKRHIKSVPIGERVMQRALADNALVPVLGPTFVYDNGACMKNKGYDFAMRRLVCHLSRYYRKYGSDGYILVFDFRKFYESIVHSIVERIVDKTYSDPWIRHMTRKIINTFGDVGLGLGSQISQILALATGSPLDHTIKQNLQIEEYARYNDDGYLIHTSKEYLWECLKAMQEICDELHINLNLKKTQIIKLSHGFKFLKARIYLTPTGKIIRKIPKRNITRERRKLKALRIKLNEGKVDLPHIEIQYQSWRANAKKYSNSWLTIQNMDTLFFQLYIVKEAA